jgi:hypothetical protein
MLIENVKSLIAVLVLAVPALYLGQRFSGAAGMAREFVALRNAWIVATIAAYLSGQFLVFAGVLLLICLFAQAARIAGLALFFVLLIAVPFVRVEIGGFGLVNYLIDVNHGRLLVVVLLLPALLRAGGFRNRQKVFPGPDYFIVSYVILMVILQSRDSTVTNAFRIATEYALDVLIPYFAFSRLIKDVTDLRKVLLGFVVVMLPLALIDAFEMLKGWRLYGSIAAQWDPEYGLAYQLRDGILRGAATAKSPIIAGYLVMVAIGCLLALWRPHVSRQVGLPVLAILGIGLIGTLSRGPWVGAAFLIVAFLATGPNAASQIGKVMIVGAVAMVLLPLTSFGAKILDFLPFVGDVEAETIEFRQSLFENAMVVIERNFWLGSVNYRQTPELLALADHTGMVDIVNHYIKIALDSGIVGLILFLGFFATILLGLRRVLRFNPAQDSDIRLCARALLGILLAVLVTIATVSSIEFVPYVYWSFGGLSVALIRIALRERAASRTMQMHRVPA